MNVNNFKTPFQGSGEPRPQLSWSREGGLLPDGETSARGDQLIFSAVTRDHAGTFVCSGTTQTGAGARDSVSVTVHCEYTSASNFKTGNKVFGSELDRNNVDCL